MKNTFLIRKEFIGWNSTQIDRTITFMAKSHDPKYLVISKKIYSYINIHYRLITFICYLEIHLTTLIKSSIRHPHETFL